MNRKHPLSSFAARAGVSARAEQLDVAPAMALISGVALISSVMVIAGLANVVDVSMAGWLAGLASATIVSMALARGISRHGVTRLRPADWVTLTRATVAVGVAALVAQAFAGHAPVALLVSLAAFALVLDAVDGWVARRSHTDRTFGARFDGEVDAFLILVLSMYGARSVGVWVLAIGAARYVFLLGEWRLPWMRAPLPARYWRKVVAATQGIVLTIAAAGVIPTWLVATALAVALALLAESFGRDAWWLWDHRAEAPQRAPGRDSGAASAPSERHRSVAASVSMLLTLLAALLVWAALVAPDQPSAVTPAAFARIPLEGVALLVLALVVPVGAQRLLAGVAGPALTLLVIVKVLDVGFLSTFDRPFDPVGDTQDAGIGIETLRGAIGRTQADVVVVAAVVVVVALLVLSTLAVLRLARVARGNRHRSLKAAAVIASVWLVCSLSGAELLARTPIASTSAAALFLHEVHAVRADIHDRGVFARWIAHDPLRFTPSDRLLTALRGKDVLLVFVESYGRVTVQGSSFSPTVDALLNRGTHRLRAAGFSARSAFLTSSTFGGISWLAHSTLQSGVWVNTQRRYGQLVATDRFTLSDAFKRAGWRTVDDAPADDRPWGDGARFYHYDKLYDRRDIGYRGPDFTYAPMPDQYMFLALQRLELAKVHRRPLFAEVDTVSSHMPWNRIPQMVPWNEVGNGSIFNHTPMDHETGAFWSNPPRVRAAYARSIEYSLNTLISFVQQYGRPNLVLVVVGDEQPLPIVSGHTADHDVPVSIIAHDPSVLAQIAGWRWGDGLLPRADAPVWPMSAFRDRFLTAFDSRAGGRS